MSEADVKTVKQEDTDAKDHQKEAEKVLRDGGRACRSGAVALVDGLCLWTRDRLRWRHVVALTAIEGAWGR